MPHETRFTEDAPLADIHAPSCRCGLHGRRLFTAGLLAASALPAWARKEPPPIDPQVACKDFGKVSIATKMISAEQIEDSARMQYAQMLSKATSQRALGPESHPQVQRLRAIADRIVPFTGNCNPRVAQWKWEVNLLGSQQLNAFCMPGGKIAFFHGILAQLQLDDDEVAAIMGHEIAHALREHARERIGKTMATRGVASVIGAVLGVGAAGDMLLSAGSQLLTLQFGREDETEADLVGMELAARAGYNPAAGVTLWQKMITASKGAPPKWLSTHPSGKERIKEIQAKLPRVQPLFDAAPKPTARFEPPAKPAPATNPSR
jgi:predicted Zn-dependent protease